MAVLSWRRAAALLPLAATLLALCAPRTTARAADTPDPSSVTIAGSLQSELGCPGDWQPECTTTRLVYDASDDKWQASFALPLPGGGETGYEYKATLNGGWAENYGLNARRDGPNIPLALPSAATVKFFYDHESHWVTDNRSSVIASVPGSFQSELGCPGDWQPDCLRSWLQDTDGDGTYTFSTGALPAGTYEAKVAINESWDENYGEGGAPGGANIQFTVPRDNAEIYFEYNAVTHVLRILDGAPKGNISLAKAHWLSRDTIAWQPASTAAASFRLHWDGEGGLELGSDGVTGGQSLPLTYDPAGLSAELKQKFPHLAAYAAFRIPGAELARVPEILRSQLAVSAVDGGQLADATSLQLPGVLDDLYGYDGALGVSWQGSGRARAVPTLRLWAPTARSVRLHMFADSKPATTPTVHPMTLDAASGVWSVTGTPAWRDKFYVYEVEVWVRTTGRVERNLVTDPYSVSLALNSTRSQVVDLQDPTLLPYAWDKTAKPALPAPEDIVLYELHIRDFSIFDGSVPDAERGTYRAFTRLNSDGMRHLRGLAQAGLTHLHLLPSFDIASIEENKALRREPDPALLASYPPDSEQQQAAVEETKDQDGFNWGYDPYHYTTPEGSYSTQPDGSRRILEYREMVQALNRIGLRVVMDVVYNHTAAAGQDQRSVLDRVVPGYYHRLNAIGQIETSTCCQNTATEHAMMEKLMVDSLVTWARAYKVDGFRFDLMGHHSRDNLLAVRRALDALTPARDGVDGKAVYLYGEGWNFGEVANNARFVQATQSNMAGTGVGTFSDRLRDAVRGGGPFDEDQRVIQGFATGLYVDPNGLNQGSPGDQRWRLLGYMDWIRVGLAGNLSSFRFEDRSGQMVSGGDVDYNGQPAGYTADPQEVITYIEAHDNETLFDIIQLKAPPHATMADRVRMQNLGNSVVLLGQGVPFFQAGQDLLRSKSLDRNSYNSGDWFNRVDWTYSRNNWGVGLPPGENRSKWPYMRPLLANPALRPTREHIVDAAEHFREMLVIRKSSPLFRLRTADQINARVAMHNTGPDQIPGLVVMSIADGTGAEDLDPRSDLIVVLFNASPAEVQFSEPMLRGRALELHPLQQRSADAVVRRSRFDAAAGTFTIPGRTAAVFVLPQGR